VVLMLAGALGLLTSLIWYGRSTSRGGVREVWYRPRYTRAVERRDDIV
jgi:hypothetical protein